MTVRTALVTGIVGGIGAAIATRLAANGAKVVVSDLPGDALHEAAAMGRKMLGDGSFGGPWQRPDADMLAIWEVGVAETRAALEGPWAEFSHG